jgi:RND family efflux transporter MFP subunit
MASTGSWRGPWATLRPAFAGITIALAVTAIACNPLEDGPRPFPTPTVRPTSTPNRAYATVRSGTIIDAVKTLGRVVAAQEADLSFRNTGRVRDVHVQPGQLVQAGQVLAELDQSDLPWQLARANLAVTQAEVRLAGARAKVIADTSVVDGLVVELAASQLAGAQLAAARLDAPVPDADLLEAKARLAQAHAARDAAVLAVRVRDAEIAAKRAELALKERPADPTDVARAALEIDAAKVRLAQASAGPLVEDVRAAEVALDQERTRLARLTDAPRARPEDVEGARLDLRRAEAVLDRVVADIDAGVLMREATRGATLETARNNVATARNLLDKLLAGGPTDGELEAQRAAVRLAQVAIERVTHPPAFDAETARTAIRRAEASLGQVAAGASQAERATARAQVEALVLGRAGLQGAVAVAEANVVAAQARLDVVTRGPDDLDRRDAAGRVAAISSQLGGLRERASTNRQVSEQARAIAAFDEETLRRAVEQARLDVGNFENQTGDVRIIAPFTGRITRLAVRPGDNVNAFMPMMNVSSLEGLVVKADISEAELPRLGVGMPVELQMDIFPGQVVMGRITTLPVITTERVGAAPDRSTRIAVDWPASGATVRPELGMLARVQVTLLRKPDVLLVPNAAIKVVGKRKFVEYMDGEIRRSRNVEVGIVTETETEVLTGVQAGMVVIAGQT